MAAAGKLDEEYVRGGDRLSALMDSVVSAATLTGVVVPWAFTVCVCVRARPLRESCVRMRVCVCVFVRQPACVYVPPPSVLFLR